MRDLKRNGPLAMPAVLVLLVAIGYLGFVFGYPQAFPGVAQAHPRHYKANVDRARAAGQPKKALRIARHAAGMLTTDPAFATLYGQLLLEAGETDAAVAQFERAVRVDQTPGPDYRRTGKPYYFAQARLEWGKLCRNRDDPLEAVAQFELARPYAAVTGDEFEAYHPDLHAVYAAWGQWARALAFGDPALEALDDLDAAHLRGLAVTCEGLARWDLAGPVAHALAAKDPGDPASEYLLGRAALATDQLGPAQNSLRRAADAGHADAPFFLGQALERAGDPVAACRAYLETPCKSLFRAFAVAKVLLAESAGGIDRQALLDELDHELERPRELPRALGHNRHERFWPLAAAFSRPYFEAGGAFPILILWEDRNPAPTPDLALDLDAAGTVTLTRGARRLQLQWVVNELAFSGFEALPEGASEPPGWRGTPHLWPETDGERMATITSTGHGNRFLEISNAGAPGNAMLVSVPVRLREGTTYLVAGRLQARDTTAWYGWTALDEAEQTTADKVLKSGSGLGWVWVTAYVQPVIHWDVLTVQVGVYEAVGATAYDDLMVLAVREPADSPGGE